MKVYVIDLSSAKREAEAIYSGSEREARRRAAKALGSRSLRGLVQVPTPGGIRVYGRGSTDYEGASVELVW